MKKNNASYRARGTDAAGEDAGLYAKLLASGRRTLILQPHHRTPFAGYALLLGA